jgi:predicted nucleic acid-binding protein
MLAVLADTSAIIDFFRPNGRDDVRQEIGRLLDVGHLAVCGIVVAELLQGVREEERQPLLELINECQVLEITMEDYCQAGELSNSLRRKGYKIPMTDMIIASVALRTKSMVLTLDKKDFGSIPGLKLVEL